MSFVLFVVGESVSHRATEASEDSRQDYRIYKIVPTSPLFVVFCVFRGKKRLEAGGGTAASPSTQGREAAAPPAHANLGAMVLATKNTKSAFFSAFSAISAVKNNAAEVFVFNRKERKERKDLSIVCFDKITGFTRLCPHPHFSWFFVAKKGWRLGEGRRPRRPRKAARPRPLPPTQTWVPWF